MKLGIIIPTFDRPEYLRKCLESLIVSEIPKGTVIVLIDDFSHEKETRDLLSEYSSRLDAYWFTNSRNEGVCFSLKKGIDFLTNYSPIKHEDEICDTIINLDSDAIVRKDWIEKIIALKERFPNRIVTGFNCLTKNANGTERHPIIEWGEGWNRKKSVGGLNMCFDKKQYEDWILPALEKGMKRLVNWDAEACKNSGGAVCTVPSVVQHIGFVSSMGHSQGNEPPDVADDFVMEEVSKDSLLTEIGPSGLPEIISDTLAQSGTSKPENSLPDEWKCPEDTRLYLPSVTLVTVNCDKVQEGIKAMNECTKGIRFGAVKMLTSADIENQCLYPPFVKIPHIPTVERYSHFISKELYKYIDTEFMLIIQSDGYVKNPAAWTDDFLKYDYIGATWWYNDKNIVGNGGFSLRSRKLMEAVATDHSIVKHHPEDHHICRTYRLHLERKHGIKFAPPELARKFSIEGHRQTNKTWSGEFGFHGGEVKFPEADNSKVVKSDHVKRKPDIIVFNQPFGLGDFIFCLTLFRDYTAQGFKVIVPVVPQYDNLNKHFPDITFINKEMLNIDLERKDEYEINGMRVYPLRWSYEILKVPFRDCMKSKYGLFKQDWKRWRDNCSWVRDTAKEDELFYKVLGLHDGAEYNLTNSMFRCDTSGKAVFQVSNGYKNIPLQTIEGFTLFDWGKVIQNAITIHTVSTSLNYLLETMELKAKEIHLYIRRPDERDFRNIDYLFTRKYKLHY